MGKLKSSTIQEDTTANAFKKAGEQISAQFKKLVSWRPNQEEDEEGGGGNAADVFKAAGERASFRYQNLVEWEPEQKDTDIILDGNEALQKFLMDHEKEFGKVSTERKAYRKKNAEQGNNLQTGLPHHPLLDTQRFDGISPDESPEATINPTAVEELEEIVENDPKLVNNPQLRMALEHRKQLKMNLAQKATPTPI